MVVGAEQIQVAVTLANGNKPGPQPQAVLVGSVS